jgi:hypothetical protein
MKSGFLACYCLLFPAVLVHYQGRVTTQAIIKKDTLSILNNFWTIDGPPEKEKAEMPDEFLPPGTKFQIKVKPSPDRVIIEEEGGPRDSLVGELILLPPFPQGICKTGLGEETMFATNVCEDGKVIDLNSPVSFDTQFIFERWSRKTDLDLPDNTFFKTLGAKNGAQIVTISPLRKNVSWRLWIYSNESLAGMYTIYHPSKRIEVESQFWNRTQP